MAEGRSCQCSQHLVATMKGFQPCILNGAYMYQPRESYSCLSSADHLIVCAAVAHCMLDQKSGRGISTSIYMVSAVAWVLYEV